MGPTAPASGEAARPVGPGAAGLVRHLDPLEMACRRVIDELQVGLPAQDAGDELGERLGHDEADRLVTVTPDQGPQGGPDSVERLLDRLALGRANRAGVVEPLAEQLEIAAADLIELQALPEALVEVPEILDPPGPEP